MLDPAVGQGHAGGQPGRSRAHHHGVDHPRPAPAHRPRGGQRGPQRPPERLRLLDHEVAGVLDHVERPAVAGAGRLGDPQPHHPVVATPDERGRDRDPGQLLGRDRLGPELPQHPAVGGPDARGAGTVQVVGLGRLPALAHHRLGPWPGPPPPAGGSPAGCARSAGPGTAPGRAGRPARAGTGRGCPRPPAPAADTRSGWAIANRAAMEAPSEAPTSTGGAGQVSLDQRAEPGEHAGGVRWAVGQLRGAQARQVGRDHAMGRHQVTHDRQPHPRPAALAVQQHHRRAVPALQHGRRHPGQLHPPLGDRCPGQHPPPGLVTAGVPVAVLHDPLPAHGRSPLRETPTPSPVIVGDRHRAA